MFGNIGLADRIIRGLVGVGFAVYAFMFNSIIFGVFSFLIIAMASFKWCPLYHIFGINTDYNNTCSAVLNSRKSVTEGIIISIVLYIIIFVLYFIYRYYSIVDQPLIFK